ncbi:MAG TPA: glycogen synthase GlgA [Kofleriaceae bacterium]|nr:glycogen synthase GlgA [Kofleriaceae bacterium]
MTGPRGERPARVLHVASEVAPWAATGGLADVVAALPPAIDAALPGAGATVVPLYREARARLAAAGVALVDGPRRTVALGAHRIPVVLRRAALERGPWFVDCPSLYDRDGLYGAGGHDHDDNHLRFAVLARAALDAGPELLGGPIELVHGHDWQAGLAIALVRFTGLPAATIFTVHNLAFQGAFDRAAVAELGLPWSAFDPQHLEAWGRLSFLKAGLAYADVVTTVSPSYAAEVLTPEGGDGLDGFLRHDVAPIVGVVNGIDDAAWDPARDRALPATFDRGRLQGKARCRAALAAELGLDAPPGVALAIVVSRLSWQKGIDLCADLVPALAELPVVLAVLGSGDAALEGRLRALAAAHPRRLAVRIGFDPALARRMYGGGDLLVMPSRFEPCGLAQLYAMRYGTVPVVSSVGGLRDTVIDPGDAALAAGLGTGFRFDHVDAEGLRWALARAAHLFAAEPAAFAAVRAAGMARDSSWAPSARVYAGLYRQALARR